MEEQPTLTLTKVSFMVWIVPKVISQLIKFDNLAFNLYSSWLGSLDSVLSVVLWYILELVSLLVFVAMFASSKKYIVRIGKRHKWLLATIVLFTRAVLNFLAVSSSSSSFALGIINQDVYNAHRAFVGFFSLASCQRGLAYLKPWLPYCHGSLLVWILYSLLYWTFNYARMVPNLFAEDIKSISQFAYAVMKFHASIEATGFTRNRVYDAVDVVSTIALHVLVEQIRRSEIIISLLGPVKVVDGILFAAKSLGTFVVRPDQLLQWLDSASPPPTLAWTIFSAQYSAVFLGVGWGLTSALGIGSNTERLLACYAVVITVPFTLMNQHLPPPYENRNWNQALASRHRLLFLIPELDSGVRSKLHFVIKFFERYEKAYAQTTHTWTTSVEWVDKTWTTINLWMKRNVGSRIGYVESEADFQVVQESEVPIQEAVDEENDNSYYSRFVRYLKNKQRNSLNEACEETSLSIVDMRQENVQTETQGVIKEEVTTFNESGVSDSKPSLYTSIISWFSNTKCITPDPVAEKVQELCSTNATDKNEIPLIADDVKSSVKLTADDLDYGVKISADDVENNVKDILKDLVNEIVTKVETSEKGDERPQIPSSGWKTFLSWAWNSGKKDQQKSAESVEQSNMQNIEVSGNLDLSKESSHKDKIATDSPVNCVDVNTDTMDCPKEKAVTELTESLTSSSMVLADANKSIDKIEASVDNLGRFSTLAWIASFLRYSQESNIHIDVPDISGNVISQEGIICKPVLGNMGNKVDASDNAEFTSGDLSVRTNDGPLGSNCDFNSTMENLVVEGDPSANGMLEGSNGPEGLGTRLESAECDNHLSCIDNSANIEPRYSCDAHSREQLDTHRISEANEEGKDNDIVDSVQIQKELYNKERATTGGDFTECAYNTRPSWTDHIGGSFIKRLWTGDPDFIELKEISK